MRSARLSVVVVPPPSWLNWFLEVRHLRHLADGVHVQVGALGGVVGAGGCRGAHDAVAALRQSPQDSVSCLQNLNGREQRGEGFADVLRDRCCPTRDDAL